jgi:hypothetical protein
MLSDRVRVLLFWFTILMMLAVAVVAALTILQAFNVFEPKLKQETTAALTISPAEVSLCTGEQQRFTVDEDVEITWQASGGTIDENGIFTAGEEPGDYVVEAGRGRLRKALKADVHVIACTPVPTMAPSPTLLPSPTPPPATATPTMAPPTPTPVDPQGDIGTYATGAPAEAPGAGIDIRDASVASDLSVALQSPADVPPEFANLAGEGEVLLWIALHEPAPAQPEVYTDWLFSLDLDGNVETGRPAGSARINPDLGDEAVIGVRDDAGGGGYAPYLLVWSPAQGGWEEVPDAVRYQMNESRTLIGLVVSLDTLTQAVAETTGVTLAPDAVNGRAAALSYVGGEGVIDFYPDR